MVWVHLGEMTQATTLRLPESTGQWHDHIPNSPQPVDGKMPESLKDFESLYTISLHLRCIPSSLWWHPVVDAFDRAIGWRGFLPFHVETQCRLMSSVLLWSLRSGTMAATFQQNWKIAVATLNSMWASLRHLLTFLDMSWSFPACKPSTSASLPWSMVLYAAERKKNDSCSIVLQAKVAASGSSLTYITHHRIMSSPLGFVRGTRHLPRNISRYTTSQWVVFPKYTLVARIISMGTEGVSPFSLKSATCTATCSPHGPLTRPTQTAAPPER